MSGLGDIRSLHDLECFAPLLSLAENAKIELELKGSSLRKALAILATGGALDQHQALLDICPPPADVDLMFSGGNQRKILRLQQDIKDINAVTGAIRFEYSSDFVPGRRETRSDPLFIPVLDATLSSNPERLDEKFFRAVEEIQRNEFTITPLDFDNIGSNLRAFNTVCQTLVYCKAVLSNARIFGQVKSNLEVSGFLFPYRIQPDYQDRYMAKRIKSILLGLFALDPLYYKTAIEPFIPWRTRLPGKFAQEDLSQILPLEDIEFVQDYEGDIYAFAILDSSQEVDYGDLSTYIDLTDQKLLHTTNGLYLAQDSIRELRYRGDHLTYVCYSQHLVKRISEYDKQSLSFVLKIVIFPYYDMKSGNEHAIYIPAFGDVDFDVDKLTCSLRVNIRALKDALRYRLPKDLAATQVSTILLGHREA